MAAQKLFTIYNGTITAIQYINNADGNLGSWSVADSSQRLRITLQANSSQVVLAWGGHIASRRDWGDGNSANAVPGSPYHARLIALDGSGGNQDRALAAAAVCMPPNCAISGPTTVCTATPSTYTAQTDGTGNTFLWSITGNGTIVGSTTGPSVQVASGAPGSFTLTVTISRPLASGGCSTTCSQTVTVSGLPSCSISRLNDPSSQSVGATLYQGPAGMAHYTWTVSYNGDPAATAGGDQPSISLADPTAQSGQTATVTVGLMVTDINGCTSSCVRTFQAPGECILKPAAGCPRSTETFNYGGDPTGSTFLWSIVTPGSPVTIVGANNQPSVNLTSPVCAEFILRLEVTAPDGFVTVCETTGAFVDITRPVLGNLPIGGDLGCNPVLPTCSRTVSAIDDCDGDISGRVVCTPGLIVENGACSRQQTFTYSVSDSCGNTTSAVVTYTWKQDTTAPVFSNLPIGGDLGCNPALPRCSETVTAADDCDGNVTAQIVCTPGDVIETSACGRSRSFVYTVTDGCGNVARATVVFTWREDTTPPVLNNLPTGGDLGCNPATLPTCSRTVTATDLCDGDVTASVVCTPGPIVNINGCLRSQTFTYTAKDSCGNEVRNEVNYTWKQDTTAPVFSNLPIGGDIGCNPALPRCSEAVTALDDCDGNLTAEIVCTPGDVIQTSACGRSRTFVYTVRDTCGNVARATVTFTWREDTTPPILGNLPIGGELGCNPTLPTCSRTVTATDLCDGDVTASVVCTPGPIISINGCQRSQTFTYTAQDACGNQVRNEVNYTWREDTIPPVLANLPAGGDLGCNPTRPTCSPLVTARDNCDGDLSAAVVCTPGPVLPVGLCGFTQTFTYTVQDSCGNRTTADVVYTWRDDNVAPVMSNLPAGGDLGCNPIRPTCSTAVTATDNCDGNLTAAVVCTPGPILDAGLCGKTQVFTYQVQDACGNLARVVISYAWREDLTPPALGNLPTGGDLGCNPIRPTCSRLVTARDNCDGDLSASVVCTPGQIQTVNGCGFTQTFTYSVADSCGNRASADVVYVWREDTIAPELGNLPPGGDLGCNPIRPTCSTAVVARDLCDGDLTGRIVCTPGPILDGPLCRKTQTFTYSVTDRCGNAASSEVTYTWREDIVVPTLGNLPTGGDLGCNPTRPTCSASVTARDNCDGDLSASIVCIPGQLQTVNGCGFTQTFTYSVADSCGNRASADVVYVWREDTIAPELGNLPPGGDLGCNPIRPTCSTAVVARDLCDGDLTGRIVCTPGPIVEGPLCRKTQTFTYSVTDRCGNAASSEVTYTWREDLTQPELGNLPVGGDLGCNPIRPSCSTTVTARDNCDGDLSASVVCIPGQIQTVNGCGFTQTFTYSVTDSCGNRASADVVYVWREDTTAPELGNLPPGGDLGCNPVPPICSTTVIARDLCDGDLSARVRCVPGPIVNGVLCRKTQVFTYTVADRCGNIAEAAVTYTWIDDRMPPVIVCPAVQSPIECPGVPVFPEATVSDDCDPAPRMVYSDRTIPGACPQSYSVVRTWTATDACGNSSSCSATIEVRDTLPPIVVWPGDVNLACTDCNIDPANTGTPTAEDLCGTITITHTDTITGTCPKRVERRWTVSDGCNEISQVQIILCLPTTRVVVTDSSLCTFDVDPATRCRDFRLLFTPDGSKSSKSRLNASNPGQTFFNLFYNGKPGTMVTLNLTIPYPYITQGAQPIHAYDSVTVVPGLNGQECYIPGNAFFVDSTQIVLANYGTQAMGASTSVSVTLTVPASGFVYLNMHLDYGLKGTTGYAKGGPSGNDAVDASTLRVLIPDRGSYLFAFSDGSDSASDMVCNINDFKKSTGIVGMVKSTSDDAEDDDDRRGSRREKQGCSIVLKDAKGQVLATGKTDADGWYSCDYKWSGKSTTVYLTLKSPGDMPQTKPVTITANGCSRVDFEIR